MNIIKDKEKLQKIINKVILPIEFIISLLLVYVVFRFMFKRNYEEITSIKHIILSAFFGILTLGLIIYNAKINKDKFEKIVISFLIPLGMFYSVFMIPSQVPDEQAHVWRAYEVSEGVLVSSREHGTIIPRDLEKVKPQYLGNYHALQTAIYQETDYNDKIEIENPAKTYPFILYIFSSIGFLIARIFDLNIIIGCYLGKMFNFIAFLIATYYSIKIIPFGKFAITAVVFMPMFIHQATSTSADCITNCIAMFFICFTTYLIFKNEKINRKEQVVFGILSVLIAIAKYVYLPIVALGFILIFSKNLAKKEKIIMLVSTVIVAGFMAVALLAFNNTYPESFDWYHKQNNIDSTQQIKGIIQNPIEYIKVLLRTLKDRGEGYIRTMVGQSLGWLNIPVSSVGIMTYVIIMLGACFVEENKVAFNTKQKMWIMLLAIAIVVLIITGLYFAWTPVGAAVAEGIQGRYFIPVAFLVLLCLSKKENYVKIKNIQYKLPIILCLLNGVALLSVYRFFG